MAEFKAGPEIYENGQRMYNLVNTEMKNARKKGYLVIKGSSVVKKWSTTIQKDSMETFPKEMTSSFGSIHIKRSNALLCNVNNSKRLQCMKVFTRTREHPADVGKFFNQDTSPLQGIDAEEKFNNWYSLMTNRGKVTEGNLILFHTIQ